MAKHSPPSTTPPATGTPRNTANPLATFGTGDGGSQPPGADATQKPDLSAPYNTNPDAFGMNQQDVTVQVPFGRALAPLPSGSMGPPTNKIQFETLPKYMASIEKLDPQSLKAMQQQLFNAGYYPAGYYSSSNPSYVAATGVPDQAFKSALRQAALDATSSQGQYTVGEMLQQRSQGLAAGASATPYQTSTQNITTAVKALGPQLLGKEVPDEVVNKIVATLHGSEDAAAKGQTGSEKMVSPDGAWYQEQLKELMPHTVKAYQTFEGLTSANLGGVNTLGKNG